MVLAILIVSSASARTVRILPRVSLDFFEVSTAHIERCSLRISGQHEYRVGAAYEAERAGDRVERVFKTARLMEVAKIVRDKAIEDGISEVANADLEAIAKEREIVILRRGYRLKPLH